jgi:glycosyltransferase involved in cell wall biosynthesis
VILAGFIPEEEMADFFGIADMYVMPSKKEGFGLIFVEAMYHGLPVIAGNVDGSVDALANGSLGILVNPDEQTDITNAIQKMIDDTSAYIPDSKLVIDLFSFQTYQNNLLQIL